MVYAFAAVTAKLKRSSLASAGARLWAIYGVETNAVIFRKFIEK
jgi:hypothetical protein